MFRFSITDLGIFLGKSPVTIRAWERKGFVRLPRVGVNRSLATQDVRLVAAKAFNAGRIDGIRYNMITDALDALGTIEGDNR